MEGHQRNLPLYDRFNTQVVGVSRDDVTILKYWGDELGVNFPLLSNVTAYLGSRFGVQEGGSPVFSRRTLIVDRAGVVRYARDGSPDYKDILLFLKQLDEEGQR